ncbi:MAG: hypothetical protein NT150_08175 [Bacteroidetes bacterium]|nr:hypothetical protein [Bacteroidota bacterium]
MKKICLLITAIAVGSTLQAQFTNTNPTTTTGAVGIGITNPAVMLHVRNGASVGSPNIFNGDDALVVEGNNALIKLYGNNVAGLDFSYGTTGERTRAYLRYSYANNQLAFNNPSGQAFIVDGTGRFGIGVASPTAKLHVGGNLLVDGSSLTVSQINTSAVNGTSIENYTIPHIKIQNLDDANGTGAYNGGALIFDIVGGRAIAAIAGTKSFTNSDASQLKFYTHQSSSGPLERMIIGENGYIGVGISDPQQKLHINNDNGDVQIAASSSNHSSIRFSKNGTGSWMAGTQFHDGTIKFCINNSALFDETPELTILSGNSNVGINNINPQAKLHVSGDVKFASSQASFATIINNTAAAGNGLQVKAGTLGNIYAIIDASDNIGNSYFRVSGLDGITYAREVTVTADAFPDYVFENNYKLMPIYELEKFIDKNNHLPNINTAAEIKDSGLSLGDMQVKQMEKIEELTLYIIQLKKEIDALKESK